MTNEQIRADFERDFPLPEGFEFNSRLNIYMAGVCSKPSVGDYNNKWRGYQAANARYAVSEAEPFAYCFTDVNGRPKEFCDEPKHAHKQDLRIRTPLYTRPAPAAGSGAEPVAEVVSKYGDPEAFGEREIKLLTDIQKLPYRTKLYTSPAPAVPEGMVQVRIDDLRKALGAVQIPPWSSLYKDHPKALKRLAKAANKAMLTQATKESDK